MARSELLDQLIYSTRHGAGFILRRYGRVVPGGIYFVDVDDPRMDFCFPKEDNAKASDDEVFALVEAELRGWAARSQTCAIAMVTEVVLDGQRAMKLQAETRRASGTDAPECVIMHCRLRRKLWWWVLGDAEEGEGLIVERFFDGHD